MVGIFNLLSAINDNSTMLVVFYVLVVIGQWKVFEKAGEEGWKSLIPIYNVYVLWKIAGKNFIRTVFIAIGLMVLAIIFSGIAIGNSMGFLTVISTLLYFAFVIYLIVAVCGFCDKLSKSFGHGFGFALGLLILQPIFLLILGFNEDEYLGIQ